MENEKLLKSFAFHDDKCWFVSTIERTYDTYEGESRGEETFVWEYDWESSKRGKIIWQGGGIADHQRVCVQLVRTGKIAEDA